MKTALYFFTFLTLLATTLSAQVPQKLSWQGILRDASGNPITAAVELRFTILQGTNAVFTEEKALTPNSFGLAVWNIGEKETADFATIDWAGGIKTLKVELRTTVGSGNFTVVGTEELKSVPYALVAGKALSDQDNQSLGLNGNVLSISGGNGVTLPVDGDGSPTNEIQTITLSGQTLTLSNGGGSVALPVDGDGSPTNEIQTISLAGQTLSLSNGGGSVALPPNTDAQTLSVAGQNLTISSGNTVALPTDGDGSATNEIQALSLTGNTLTLSNGGGAVTLPTGTTYTAGSGISITGNVISNSGDGDNNPANEIQALSLAGQTLSLSNGGGSVALPPNIDAQTLSVAGQNLTISSGNTVALPTDGDGSATNEIQALSLTGNTLSLSNGGGAVTLPTGTTYTAGSGISITGNVISNSGDGDSSPSNEIQALSLTGNTLALSNGGGTVLLPDTSSSNEIQQLTLVKDSLQLSNGGGLVLLPDTSSSNEIQQLTLVKDSLRLSNGGGFVTLKDTSATNEIQTLALAGNTLSLSKGGGNVNLPTAVNYQAGSGIYFSGNTINALDENPTNELQALSLSGSTLSISSGNSVNLPGQVWESCTNFPEVTATKPGITRVNIGYACNVSGGALAVNGDVGVNGKITVGGADPEIRLNKGGNFWWINGNYPEPLEFGWNFTGARMAIHSDGNVDIPGSLDIGGNIGINTSTPQRRLEVLQSGSPQLRLSQSASTYWDIWGGSYLNFDNGSGTYPFNMAPNGNLGLSISPTSYRLEVNGSAAKPGGGSWTATSDRRLKQDIRPYTDGLADVLKIKPVHFRYNELSGYDTKPEYIGVVAQELQETAPYMVGETPRTTADGTEAQYLSVDNSAMVYMLINAVKEQQAQIKQLEARIMELEKGLTTQMAKH